MKLKAIRQHIKQRNVHINGNVDHNIRALELKQFEEDENGASDEIRKEIAHRLQDLYTSKSLMVRQKARLKWS